MWQHFPSKCIVRARECVSKILVLEYCIAVFKSILRSAGECTLRIILGPALSNFTFPTFWIIDSNIVPQTKHDSTVPMSTAGDSGTPEWTDDTAARRAVTSRLGTHYWYPVGCGMHCLLNIPLSWHFRSPVDALPVANWWVIRGEKVNVEGNFDSDWLL